MFGSVERLPYIPPPDYTILHKPSKPIETRRHQAKDDHGKPHHYLPEIKKPPPKPRPVSMSIDEEPLEEPRNQSPEEVQRRVFRMLREQGVPVFPTTPLKQAVEQGNAANLGPTRAYIKHLENHRKYDTLKSFRSCDNCALCKQMQKEIRILEHGIPQKRDSDPPQAGYYQPAPDYNQQDPIPIQNQQDPIPIQNQHHQIQSQPQLIEPHHHKKRSSGSRSEIISGRLFEPLREVEVEEFPDEPEEFAEEVVERNTKLNGISSVGRSDRPYSHRHNLSVETNTSHSTASPEARRRIIRVPEARVRRDFKAESPQQLSVDGGERVKVIQSDAIWSLCTTQNGQMGWVPSNNLQFDHSSSLGSSPGST